MAKTTSWDDWDEAAETESVTIPIVNQLLIRKHTGKFDSNRFKMLIYGESGTGKTRFAATFPKCIFADIDKGMASVDTEVDVLDVDAFEQLEDLYTFLHEGTHDYETVVIDTLNEMQRIAMHATVEEFPGIRRAYDDLPSQSDYGKMLHDMIELTLKFAHLPMRVVLLSQVVSKQFDTDVLQPQLIGKNTARDICRKMDIIGYIYKSEKEDDTGKKLTEIAFDSSEYVTKDRSFRLPAVMPDPSFEKLNTYWKQK